MLSFTITSLSLSLSLPSFVALSFAALSLTVCVFCVLCVSLACALTVILSVSRLFRRRNAKFSDGLAQSRLRFLGDLENLFGMTGPLEETLDKLEEVCTRAHKTETHRCCLQAVGEKVAVSSECIRPVQNDVRGAHPLVSRRKHCTCISTRSSTLHVCGLVGVLPEDDNVVPRVQYMICIWRGDSNPARVTSRSLWSLYVCVHLVT